MVNDRRLVLVVEDEAVIRMAVTDALQCAGFDVLETGSGDEALATLEGRPEVDVLFTDINMPGIIDGLALVKLASARWPRIALFATTGKPSPELSSQLPAGTRFFAKPYDWDELVAAIKATPDESRRLRRTA
jgi:CheY-like chemotaxis protein